jgi:hypothetical protein
VRIFRSLLACLVFGYVTASARATCIQDQYGNQYNFTIDAAQGFVYGNVVAGQSCSTPTWALTGTFSETSSGVGLELTAANPTTDDCVAEYTLKGIYPNFDWFYNTGYHTPQPSTYVACGSTVSKEAVGKGRLK